jgi:hypothetical protein
MAETAQFPAGGPDGAGPAADGPEERPADGGATRAPSPARRRFDPRRIRRGPWIVVLGIVLLFVVYHLWWLRRMRDGQPVDVDEAGYLGIGLNDLAGLRNGGLDGLWDIVQAQTPHAPLVPLLAVPVLAIHKGVVVAFAVELLALALAALATYGLARRLMGFRWALLAMVTVIAAPGVLSYAREFSFALPCTAATPWRCGRWSAARG